MKIISFNTFAGTVFEPLMEFITTHAPTTDVFCFQEILKDIGSKHLTTKSGMRANLLEEITARLPDFQAYYAASQDGFETSVDLDLGVQLGITIFVKKTHTVTESGDFFIYRSFNSYVPPDFSTLPSNAQFVQLMIDNQPLVICNVHATSQPGSKLDSPDRLVQSQKILDALSKLPGEKIIMGDFNLLPNTESIRMFSQAGYQDLVSDYKITSTRGSMNKKLHPEFGQGKYGFQEYSDFTFATPGVKVTSFEVPDLPLSDHLPMILNVEI
jgi:exonuclease III